MSYDNAAGEAGKPATIQIGEKAIVAPTAVVANSKFDEDSVKKIAAFKKEVNEALKAAGYPVDWTTDSIGLLDPQPGEIEIVHEIVSMRSRGMKLAGIAAFLTASNVPTRRGGRWSAEQIRSICNRAKTHGLPSSPAKAA